VNECSDSANIIHVGTLPLFFFDPSLYVDGILFLSPWMFSVIDNMPFVVLSCLFELAVNSLCTHYHRISGWRSSFTVLNAKFLAHP